MPADLLDSLTPRRRAHSLGVAAQAELAQRCVPAELRPLVKRAALLHDVGYGHPATGFHPLDGAALLASLGEDPRLVQAVATHTGAHWEAHARGIALAAFAPYDCDAEHVGLIRSVVTWADLTTNPDGEPTVVETRLGEILDRYPPDHVVHRSITSAWDWLTHAGTHPTATANEDPAAAWATSLVKTQAAG